MDLKKLQTLESLKPAQTVPVKTPTSLPGQGPSFEDTLSKATDLQPQRVKAPGKLEGIKFSNHAVDRMRTRGISYGPDDIAKINDAVGRAAAKGSKDSLILMNDSALIVSVKNNTVVTVMDKNALKENVFTNIDSTIVL